MTWYGVPVREQTERKILLPCVVAIVLGCVACGGSSSETPYPLEPKAEELRPKQPEVTSAPPRASDQGAPLTPTAPASAPNGAAAPVEPPPEPATVLD